MAKRSRESFQKRAREKARQEKQAEKRAKRHSGSPDDETLTRAAEDSLMEQYAKLSARHEAGQISADRYDAERERILDELGLETGE